MKRRITDLFKKIFKDRKSVKSEPTITKETITEATKKTGLFQPRKKTSVKWLSKHNQYQAHKSNKTQKRRKANKVARNQRQINRKVA